MNWNKRVGFNAQGAAIALLIFSSAAAARAASISYPNQGPVPPGYMFTDIAESSGTDALPLYGPPTAFPIGMTFTPTPGFSASSIGGGADLTDGQLNFTIMAGPNAPGIPSVSISEAGRYTLTGVGTAATQALAGVIMRVTVREINGALGGANFVGSGERVGGVQFGCQSGHAAALEPWTIAQYWRPIGGPWIRAESTGD